MTKAIIIDTETTGFDDPDVIQLAHTNSMEFAQLASGDNTISQMMFKPRKEIALGALATHHILDSDVANEPEWSGSWPVPEGVTYLIGHAVDFDWKAIGSPALVRRICTLALARTEFPDIDSHTLSALTYWLRGRTADTRDLLRTAHAAASDVWLCFYLLRALVNRMHSAVSWETLWELSERARIPTHFSFGKFGPKSGGKGRLIREIRHEDPGYIRWCLQQDDFRNDAYLAKALRGELV
jgi:exodeoxyribonuclease X